MSISRSVRLTATEHERLKKEKQGNETDGTAAKRIIFSALKEKKIPFKRLRGKLRAGEHATTLIRIYVSELEDEILRRYRNLHETNDTVCKRVLLYHIYEGEYPPCGSKIKKDTPQSSNKEESSEAEKPEARTSTV